MGMLEVLLKYVAFRKGLWIELICMFQLFLNKDATSHAQYLKDFMT